MCSNVKLAAFKWILVISLCSVGRSNARPQQDELDIDISNFQNRGSFDVIVTPEPLDPNFSTLFPPLLRNQTEQCNCVPYYNCDAANNTVRSDSRIDFGVIDVRFDPTTCPDILDICCIVVEQTQQPITVPPLTVVQNRAQGCGLRNVNGIDFTLIGNVNNEAGFGEFPWTVALIRKSDDACLCGGSLIHPNVVLTGNHCVFKENPSDMKIRAGEWDTQTTKERLPYQERDVSNVISHPNYNKRSLANDIALVYVDYPFVLADHIATVCLPPQGLEANSENCFASGWGKDVFGKAGKYSVIMKKVPLPIVPSSVCESQLRSTRLTKKFRLHPTFVCAGGKVGVDTCEGDGGAPLVCPVGPTSDNRYAQFGSVAWGIGCKQNLPAVYTNVAVFRNWIDNEMFKMGLDSSSYTY